MATKKTSEQFIQEAQAIHGVGTYDYSQVEYIGALLKVKIICPEHGAFKQSPSGHLTGRKCYKCAKICSSSKIRLTKEQFIIKAQLKHGIGTYDYSQINYVNSKNYIDIKCVRHGFFQQQPSAHIAGRGCPTCGAERTGNFLRSSAKQFIQEAQAIHGVGTYDYSQVEYVSGHTKVKIICPTHGVFNQTPASHKSGNACASCGNNSVSILRTYTAPVFLEKARSIHGNKYDYSLVEYLTAQDKIKILCPIHCEFYQTPTSHLRGSGCPLCAKESSRFHWIEKAANKDAILYFLHLYNESESFFKVGITYRSIKKRYSNREKMHEYQYEIIAQHISRDAARIYDWEQSILETFAHLRYRPKRPFAGATECFSEADPILAIFPL
ncbi:GIY-YIG nuclease family protein [Hymenobacter cheonanensis]|uniref:GIY-YIG nuclease family protein n=1 Tax=Hymenobacter sp. CA2-7 TaxID=3063993 RepID=UPI0027139A34|nr:GIY-YIG nuclease family protein [Hymenobacter sp. CA2-7]MDO7888170.1 GIY-YIG nuclease family protein [Hymenobacter sp. CA2-7]